MTGKNANRPAGDQAARQVIRSGKNKPAKNNRHQTKKQARTERPGETALAAAMRAALERRATTAAEERDFNAQWNLRAAFAKRGQRS